MSLKTDIDEKGDIRTTRSGKLIESPPGTTTDLKPKLDNIVAANRNAEETFKKKLREAVYDALCEQRITEDNKVILIAFYNLVFPTILILF